MENYIQLEFNFLPWDSEEIWKDIPNLKGNYQVSNLHNVRSWIDNKGNRRKEPKILKQQLNNKGYPIVTLFKNRKRKIWKVHQLMWLTWVGKIPEGYEINHISEDKTDNRLCNLNLLSHKENCNWGTRNERSAKARINHPKRSKSIVQKSLDGKIIKIWPSMREIERELEYSNGNISACCKGGYYWKGKWVNITQAYGYKWEYEKATA